MRLAMHEKVMEGRIVEYIDAGKFVCALCIGKKGNKLHILNINNRETNISVNRVVQVSERTFDITKPREELVRYIKNAEQEREELKKKVDVRELWELIESEDESFQNSYLAQIVFGDDITDAHVSALMRALFEDKIYFKFRNGRFIQNSGSQVKQIIKQKREEKLKKERIDKGGKWLKDVMKGISPPSPEFAEYIIRLLKDIFLFGKEAPDYELGSELLSKAGISNPYMIKDLLIKMGVWEEDENIELIKKGIPITFSSRIIKEASSIKEKDIGLQGREDLRNLDIFTIDGEGTKDFDDALSVEFQGKEVTVGVHISDVSEWIEPDSPIDLEARRRAVSCYLPRRQIPMLPPELSHELLSLKQGKDRFAVSLLVKMDTGGNILNYKFVPSIIRVREQLTYDIVDKSLEKKERFLALYRLANALRQKRIRNGGLDISLPEIKIIFNNEETSNISIKLASQDTPAHIIVAEFMILYNWLAARLCVENKIPLLFRTQERPVEIVPSQEGVDKLYYIFQQMRKLGPMLISTMPRPHSTLGVDTYTQATSPLRRYLDLVAQRQIKNLLLKKKPIYDTKQLEEIRKEVEPIVKEIQAITRNRIRYWSIKYLAQHIGESYKAIILDELRKRYRIVICDLLLIAEIKQRSGIILSPGTEIKVKVRNADPWRDIVGLDYDEDKTQ